MQKPEKDTGLLGEATGQCITLQKSAVTFGGSLLKEDKEKIQDVLGIFNEGGSSKYLGLPECFSGSKVEILSYLKDRSQCRFDSWFLRKLSQGRKEILIKSTASAILVFAMSCLKVPKTIINKLESMMANYWYNSDQHVNKIHWMSWDKLCLPKTLGGIGFKDLDCFNQALLAKQGWKLLSQTDSILAKFMKSKYYLHSDFTDALIGSRPSFVWRSIIHGRELLQRGLKWKVGDGNNTRVWLDKWVDDPVLGPRAP